MKIKNCFLFAKKPNVSLSVFQTINFHLINKSFSLKRVALVGMLLLMGTSYAQNDKAFGVRFDKVIQGDMLLIGNNILSKDNNSYNDDTQQNSNINMKYVDIDNDASTFSSSSANLVVPNKGCAKILYAGLYWSAILQSGDRSAINTVKFKSPTGEYNNITGEVVWDADPKPIEGNKPYVCYANVTNLINQTDNPNGSYTVANVISSLGFNEGIGLSAGWSLYIVYEDLTLTSKSITSFDGFSGITKSTGTLDIPITGFRTIPVGPVRSKIAFAALEGDKPIIGDYFKINGSTMSTTERPANDFFNSSVTDLNGMYIDRTPASRNTLGYDAGIVRVINPNNSIIKNGDTSATIQLGSVQDTYFFYFTAFAVDIIEPKIILTKIVRNNAGVDIDNKNVTLGDHIYYAIGFQNTGNDDAKSLTIRDVLPINVIFNYPEDLMALPAGVTVKSYNPATREIIFNIDNRVVKVGYTASEIRFKVQVVPSCNMLSDACSNSIDNVAYATYKGTSNPDFVLTDDPSINTNTGCLFVKKATNFLVGIDNCKFTKNEVLCDATVTLKAANGYSSYSWSSSPTGTPVLGTDQTLTVSEIGTYYVHDTAVAPCLSINETVTVISFEDTANSPVIPFADQLVSCTSDGKILPNIFLCGINASRLIQTNISDSSTIVWEKLDESIICPAATTSTVCPNESNTCSWTQVATGPDYSAKTSGQFRLTLAYPGGCFNRFYFNVFQDLLNPTATSTDIYCNTPAKITVDGVGAGYEYSLDNITYQSSNIFPNPSAGTYTVYTRQMAAANGCVFAVNGIQIFDQVLKVKTTKIVQPLCFASKGSIKVKVNDLKGQYTYTLYKNDVFVSSSGLTNALDYEFLNLDGGTTTPLAPIQYRIDVTTDNGCSDSVTVDLIMPDLLTATSSLTKPFTCNDGEITVKTAGGTIPYFYYVNGSTVFQTASQIVVVVSNPLPTGEVYNIEVVDNNGCLSQTNINIPQIAPLYITATATPITCANPTGTITAIANGGQTPYTYSKDGVNYNLNSTFSNLVSGTYILYVKDSNGCVSTTSVTLSQPIPLAITTVNTDIRCKGSNDGSIALTATGGSGSYSYSINNSALKSSSIFSELAAGTYSITVVDSENGCTITTNVTITEPAVLNTTTAITTITCSNNGSITITATGGQTPYTYSNDGVNYNLNSTFSISISGTYTLYVKDSNGCVSTTSVTLNQPIPLAITTVNTDVRCKGNNDGSIALTATGGSGSYSYSINGRATQNNNVFTGLAAGTYTVVVTDSNSCTASITTTITEPTVVLTAEATVSNQTITTIATGGTPPYLYSIDNGMFQISNTFTAVAPGSYTVFAKDLNGCIVLNSIIVNPSVPLINGNSTITQNFTQGQTLGDIVVQGENIKWYSNANTGKSKKSNETPLPLSTVLVNNTTYYASQTINGIESTERLAVTVKSSTLGTNDFVVKDFTYYPNPVKNTFTISNTSIIDQVLLISIKGETLLTQRINSLRSEIDLSHFSKGVYFLKVKSGGAEKTVKVIKE